MLAISVFLCSSLSVALATTSKIAALSSSLFSLCLHLCSLFPAKFTQPLRFKISAFKHGLAQKAVVVHFASRDKIYVGGRVSHGWFSFLASARDLKALVKEPNSFSKQEQTNPSAKQHIKSHVSSVSLHVRLNKLSAWWAGCFLLVCGMGV